MRERQDSVTGASRTAAQRAARPLDYRRGILIATLAAFLMTFLGALDTAAVPLGRRFAFWMIVMETGAVIGIGASTGICAWGKLASRPLVEGAAISLLIALPLTLVTSGAILAFLGGRASDAAGLLTTFTEVLVVTCVITAVNYARTDPMIIVPDDSGPGLSMAAAAAPTEPAVVGDRAKIMERLPVHLRDADLHAIQSEDHYLHIHTSAGSALILMRMADAVLEVDGVEGSRTHRSWWIARSAIVAVERRDGRAELTLPGNIVAPVSRAYIQPLQAKGWFV